MIDRLRPTRATARIAAALLLVAAARTAAAAPAPASPEYLADTDAKIEFAYLTEDRKALEHLLGELRPLRESEQPLELYAYAHAKFRAEQLAFAAHAARAAGEAGEDCLAALDRRADRAAKDAEGLALAAGCAGYLAELGALKHLSAAHRRDSSLEAALALAPHNPRVLLRGARRRAPASSARRRPSRPWPCPVPASRPGAAPRRGCSSAAASRSRATWSARAAPTSARS